MTEWRNTISIQRKKNEYMIMMGTKMIVTTWADDDSKLREWLSQVQQLYVKKNNKRPLVIGLFADRSTNYSNGTWSGRGKEGPYELLQLCVGNHCLLWPTTPETEAPKALKDFLDNNRTTVVGVKIKDIVRKLENEIDVAIPKTLDLRDLAEEKLGRTKGEFVKYKVHELAKLFLGEQMEVTRPNKISWYAPQQVWRMERSLSDDLVKFASIEVFLAAELGSNLLSRS